MTELAKRAVACRGWRWMPGMLAADTGLRLDEMTTDWEGTLPDLSDPATAGCLLALVREAWDDPVAHCEELFRRISGDWAVFDRTGSLVAKGATEAEALVAALEAAP